LISFRLGIKDLEKALERDPKFSIAYFVLGSVYLSMENERENAIKNYKLYLQNGHPQTNDTIHALYALSVLVNHKKRKSEAAEYYQRAKKSEEEFRELYGAHTGLSDVKKQAILDHETPEEAEKLIATYAPKKQYDQKMQQLIQSGILNTSFPPNPKRCSHCAATHAKDKPEAPLLACGACRSIWYCSRDCQVSDFKASHKGQCKQMQALKAEEQK
jgi:tetratricopeptide (TPR) repeat protein